MKLTRQITVELDITYVHLSLPIKYGTEDIPADFPGRDKDHWNAVVEIATGRIIDWPKGKHGIFSQKQVDTGTYELLDSNAVVQASIEGSYVPNKLIPGEWGDYVHLEIDGQGYITNWPKNVTADHLSEFFGD